MDTEIYKIRLAQWRNLINEANNCGIKKPGRKQNERYGCIKMSVPDVLSFPKRSRVSRNYVHECGDSKI